ncbi:unnamed protein product [Lathyrus oleraceus]
MNFVACSCWCHLVVLAAFGLLCICRLCYWHAQNVVAFHVSSSFTLAFCFGWLCVSFCSGLSIGCVLLQLLAFVLFARTWILIWTWVL